MYRFLLGDRVGWTTNLFRPYEQAFAVILFSKKLRNFDVFFSIVFELVCFCFNISLN